MSTSRATIRDLRRRNRSTLLRRLFFGGALGRQELARLTGLSSATVTNVMSSLIAEGVVIEAGVEESDGGRPRVLLRVNGNHRLVAGVDVGETRVRVELFDLAMHKRAGSEVAIRPAHHEPGVIVEAIAKGLSSAMSDCSAEIDAILGIGVGVPGVVESFGEQVVHAPAFGWSHVPFGGMIASRTGVPVLVDNGAKTMGQAEMWFGAGRGVRHAAIVLLGTGVGAAIFTDGSLYRGATSSAGELGHTSVVVGGRHCRCGANGCLEAYVGSGAILERWAQLSGQPQADEDEEVTLKGLLSDPQGDASVSTLLDETALYIGVGIANLVNLFNPERIVIGGWVGLLLGPALLPRIRDAASAQALNYPFGRVSIELGRLGSDAVALGAATLVAEQFLTHGDAVVPQRDVQPPTAGGPVLNSPTLETASHRLT
jgi:predicted NBD/HSP70 family sugar kinase